MYNTGDRQSVKDAQREARLADRAREDVIRSIMSSPVGRQYLWDRLTTAKVFTAIYPSDALAMAFAEGERNQGLRLLADIMAAAPDQFIQAMRESHERDRHTSAERGGEFPRGENGHGGTEGPGDTDPDLFDPARA